MKHLQPNQALPAKKQRRSPVVRDPRFDSWSNRDILVGHLLGELAERLSVGTHELVVA